MAIRRRLQTEQGNIPARRLPGWASVWNVAEGDAPHLPHVAILAESLASASAQAKHHMPELGLPWMHPTHGHHIMRDAGFLTAAGEGADEWPIAPLYVRDLAGRVIITSLNPYSRPAENHRFPKGCTLLEDEEGVDLLEKVFMVHFRRLEMSPVPGSYLSGYPTALVRALYRAPHHYPAKLRVDSYYQDGFRLPQTQRLFVAPSADGGRVAAAEFCKKWADRPAGESYESFYESAGGADWYQQLFQQGCTVIPTFEAFNGFFKVTEDFGMADVWPGRAVKGLHEVAEERPDASPRGTILQVLEPGFITESELVPAKVVISNGEKYASPHASNPRSLLPNLNLPHPRVAPVWGKTWLPTHPRHFESPLIWDWSPEGRFQQVSGPLWDPIHYIYASTPKILKAFRKPWEENPHLAPVPDDMQPRFHPVTALNTYDTVNTLTGALRSQQVPQGPLAHSSLDTVNMGHETASLGYHPLPTALEYELDPACAEWAWATPTEPCPSGLKNRLIPVIQPQVTVAEAQKTMVITPEQNRQTVIQPAFFPPTQQDVLHNFPQLSRFLQTEGELAEYVKTWAVYVPHVAPADLAVNVKRFFSNRAYRKALAELGADVPAAFYAYREEALAWRRLRHRLLRKYPALLAEAWRLGKSLEWAEKRGEDGLENLHDTVRKHVMTQGGIVKEVPSLLAHKTNDALPEAGVSGKIAKKTRVTKPK